MAENPNQNQNPRNFRVRYDRIIYCSIILVVMILLTTSCISSCAKKADKPKDHGSSSPVADERVSEPSQESLPVATEAGNAGYETISRSSEEVHRGDLILANEEHPVEFDTEAIDEGTSKDISFVTIKSILDTHDSPKPYTAADWEVGLDRTAALAMDAWFTAFYKKSGSQDIRMIGGYRPDSDDHDYHTGRTLVIGVYPDNESSNFYKPEGDYKWLADHAAEYGFIQRYPEDKDGWFDENITSRRSATYRYVGIAPATYISENNMCLEEFLDEIRDYSIDSMLQVKSGDAEYGMYYIPANNSVGETSFSVPSGDTSYTVSGNNIDGFIITVALNDAAASNKPSTPKSGDLDEDEEEETLADDEPMDPYDD